MIWFRAGCEFSSTCPFALLPLAHAKFGTRGVSESSSTHRLLLVVLAVAAVTDVVAAATAAATVAAVAAVAAVRELILPDLSEEERRGGEMPNDSLARVSRVSLAIPEISRDSA